MIDHILIEYIGDLTQREVVFYDRTKFYQYIFVREEVGFYLF